MDTMRSPVQVLKGTSPRSLVGCGTSGRLHELFGWERGWPHSFCRALAPPLVSTATLTGFRSSPDPHYVVPQPKRCMAGPFTSSHFFPPTTVFSGRYPSAN